MLRLFFLLCVALLAGPVPGAVQAGGKPAADSSSIAHRVTTLAENGHCAEAMPSVRKSLAAVKDRDLKRKLALDGVRCAMALHQNDSALEFLRILSRDFPDDPDALYVSIHAFSDLSTFLSQELARTAPSSYQAHELLAESFESRGNWDNAEKEYRAILKEDPNLPGIHFRLGRALLSRPNPSADVAAEAKSEFEQELKIDPNNAGAEYVLGELARQGQDWEEAVKHFSRASKLDPQFGEAFFGLGSSLVAEKQFEQAIAPLEVAVKLEPGNPDAHYSLGMAYTRVGRKQDGEKEFAIHKQIMSTGGDKDSPPDSQNK
jgi:tetratricopeptide (TPR) repeat protein